MFFKPTKKRIAYQAYKMLTNFHKKEEEGGDGEGEGERRRRRRKRTVATLSVLQINTITV